MFSINSLSARRFSSYISKARTKRIPITTKRAGKGFYKGKGSRKEGFISHRGKFVKIKALCADIVVPDLTNCKFKPYVSTMSPKNPHLVDAKKISI